MGNVRFATLLIFAFTYYVLCSCKFSGQNYHQGTDSSNFFRRSLAAIRRQQHSSFPLDGNSNTGLLHQKRSKQYDKFVEYPNVYETNQPGFELIPFNEYNRIVSALKEMLRAREEKPIILRPRPGRRSTGADFPLWHYLLDDAGAAGTDAGENVALVGEAADTLADTTLKKSAPFKPRLGKRCGSRICE